MVLYPHPNAVTNVQMAKAHAAVMPTLQFKPTQ